MMHNSRHGRRRSLTVSALSVAATLTLAACSVPQADSESKSTSVVFENSGGAFGDCSKTAWTDPFTESTGITVVKGPETDSSKVKAMVLTKQYSADVVYAASNLIQEANGKELFEAVDYSGIEKDEILRGLTPTYGVAVDTYSTILGYRTDKFGGATPTTWADFFDLTKFPGQRGVYDGDIVNVLYMALLADGVAPSELTTIDVPRALKKLDSIKSNIVWFQTGQQGEDLLGSGEVAMASIFSNRVVGMKNSGKAVASSWNGQIISSDFLAIPKGNPNAAAAQKLITFIVGKEINGNFSQCQAIGPANTKSIVNDKVAGDLPSSHLDVPHVIADSEELTSYAAAHLGEITTAFQSWKSK